MNKGLVVGTVFHPNGRRAAGVYVRVVRVTGAQERITIWGAGSKVADRPYGSTVEGYTDSNGKFALPFLWKGTSFADDLSIINITVVAFPDVNPMTTSGKAQIRGHMQKDIRALMNTSSPILSKTDIEAYVPEIASAVKKFMKGRFWNTGALTTESWIILGGTDIYLESFSARELELLPELDIPKGNQTPPSKEQHACNCHKQTKQPTDDWGSGWEVDEESFTKKVAELHLKGAYRLDEKIQSIDGCCVDPEFLLRKCSFTTTSKIKGSVMWSPITKQVTVAVCINGKRRICWYNYSTLSGGRLQITRKQCAGRETVCVS